MWLIAGRTLRTIACAPTLLGNLVFLPCNADSGWDLCGRGDKSQLRKRYLQVTGEATQSARRKVNRVIRLAEEGA
jgi:hypothetical protein